MRKEVARNTVNSWLLAGIYPEALVGWCDRDDSPRKVESLESASPESIKGE
jgi:hypothetical protein|tara:strand:- start:928 stop:1080 length:153 start_codon:yes stop_codon:yes gene_type:complete